MELFLLFPDLGLKNFFYKRFPIFTEDSKTSFRNRKWNYLTKKWNYFSYFQTSDQKTFLTKRLPFLLEGPNQVLLTGNGIVQTGNGIIQTGNVIIFPISRPQVEKLLQQNIFTIFTEESKFSFTNRKWIHHNRK